MNRRPYKEKRATRPPREHYPTKPRTMAKQTDYARRDIGGLNDVFEVSDERRSPGSIHDRNKDLDERELAAKTLKKCANFTFSGSVYAKRLFYIYLVISAIYLGAITYIYAEMYLNKASIMSFSLTSLFFSMALGCSIYFIAKTNSCINVHQQFANSVRRIADDRSQRSGLTNSILQGNMETIGFGNVLFFNLSSAERESISIYSTTMKNHTNMFSVIFSEFKFAFLVSNLVYMAFIAGFSLTM